MTNVPVSVQAPVVLGRPVPSEARVSLENLCDPPGSGNIVRYGALMLHVDFPGGRAETIRLDKRDQPVSRSAIRRLRPPTLAATPRPSVNEQLQGLEVPLRCHRCSNGKITLEVTDPLFRLYDASGVQQRRLVFAPVFQRVD